MTYKETDVIKEETPTSDEVKVFHGLRESKIQANPELMELLELNAEQLSYYLFNLAQANPYISCNNDSERQIEAYRSKNQTGQREYKELTLNDYLVSQINLYSDTEIREVMYLLIDYLDESGYIPYTYQELASKLDCDEVVVLDALTLFKRLEPTGVGARNMEEAMLVQIDMDQYAPNQAYEILSDYYQEVKDQDLVEIKKKTGLSKETIQTCLDYYNSLRPAPATLFDRQDRINLIPDISLKKADNDKLILRYNRQYIPKISLDQDRLNKDIKVFEKDAEVEMANQLKNYQVDYNQLLANLRLREELLTDVAQILAQNQAKYILGLSDEPAPLSIKNVAQQARLSVQLVYKIISSKNIEVNGYVYAMKDFINVSSPKTTRKFKSFDLPGMIREIIESTDQDLTDKEIAQILKEQNVDISSQVVKNYRQGLKD